MLFDTSYITLSLRFATVIVVLAVLISFYQTARMGRPLAHNSKSGVKNDPAEVLSHKRKGWMCLWILIIVVCLIELQKYFALRQQTVNGLLYGVHLFFNTGCAVLLIATLFRFNGMAYPRAHKPIVYPMLMCLVGSVATGIPMMYFKWF